MTTTTPAYARLFAVGSRAEPLPELERPTPGALARLAAVLATRTELWRPLLHFDADRRWYTRVAGGPGWEAWLLTWLPGQRTGLHDHGRASGAFTVLAGELTELTPAEREPGRDARLHARTLRVPDVRAFGADHVHEVAGAGDGPAASLHVYAPRLTVMNTYAFTPEAGLTLVSREQEGEDW